ncbi:MAG: phosphoribosylamine--glycine ligase [Planctomycetota bacterium]|nr:phosphoribosylamine--glycine ligase [Planctomycetota bacterium]
MKVLVVGGGGREHALAWKIAASPSVDEVICAPGNAGTAPTAPMNGVRNAPVSAGDIDGLVDLAAREGVGLVVIGPEDPLCDGLADRLTARGIAAYGPNAAGARLEGSKVFAKELLERHRIPTAAWRRFDRAGSAKAHLETLTVWPQVIKADGLAAGKGVFVCADAREACSVVDALMEERRLGDAGLQVIVEEFLVGQELSVQAITDGRALLILEPVVDHKPVGEGDTGPNTGGMGIYSPATFVSQRLLRQIEQRILIPTLHALRVEEIDYRGTLYVGLMITDAGPRVLEYNCRFGDPETQALVRRLESDLVPYLLAASEGRLAEVEPPSWDERACVGVVAAADGYPGAYRKGDPIRGLAAAEEVEEVVVFHAGTRVDGERVLTNGGRVLCVTALGDDMEQAQQRAYEAYDRIEWNGKFCRRDIGRPRPWGFAPAVGVGETTGGPNELA